MKVCLVAHGYPPELVGGTEKSVQNLAHGLARRGIEVVVVAGSMQHEQGFRTSTDTDGPVRVRRIHRADLYFDHWQKSSSARVGEAFADILRDEQPDLVHVHHWIRLTRDLVAIAARGGVPSVVTLHDLWTTCLITFRVRPDTKEFCEAPLGVNPCLDCARQVPPRTPWMSRENEFMAFAERQADLVRELELARAVIVPSVAHAATVGEFLGIGEERVTVRVVPHGRDLVSAPRASSAGREPLRLGCWGHLHPLKGPDLVIDAVRALGDDAARVELHLAGGEADPGFADALRERAAGLNVHFHGPFAGGELATHPVTEVDAMVSGTRARESWGLVVDEAAALGLPMLLPRAGAFPERLSEGEGALFYEARDADSLAGVLRRLLNEPELLDDVRGKLPSLSRVAPTMDEHVGAVLAVYDEAVRAGAPEIAAADWWQAKLRNAAEQDWDQSLTQRTAAELGFE